MPNGGREGRIYGHIKQGVSGGVDGARTAEPGFYRLKIRGGEQAPRDDTVKNKHGSRGT